MLGLACCPCGAATPRPAGYCRGCGSALGVTGTGSRGRGRTGRRVLVAGALVPLLALGAFGAGVGVGSADLGGLVREAGERVPWGRLAADGERRDAAWPVAPTSVSVLPPPPAAEDTPVVGRRPVSRPGEGRGVGGPGVVPLP